MKKAPWKQLYRGLRPGTSSIVITSLIMSGIFVSPKQTLAINPENATITVTRLFPGQYDNTKYSLTLSDPDGLSEFEIKKSDGSFMWGGTPPCLTSIETGTVTLEPSDFPLQGWVSDCLNSDTQHSIQASIPPLPGDVVINEFVSSPSADGQEWYELLNTTDNKIGLTGSTIDRAVPGDSIALSGTLPAHGILIFSTASNPANDGGDVVVLKNSSTDISAVSYGTISPEGVVHSSAPGIDESAIFAAPSTWTVTGNPTKGWFNNAGQEGAAPLLSTIDSSLSSAGIISNIGELNNPSATPTDEPDALYFEKSGKGKIVFTASLNLSDQATVAVLQTLGAAMEISDGHIAFDSTTAAAMAATGAKIYMYGLDALGYESEPTIVVKNDADEIIDGTDIVSNIAYAPGGLNGGELSFGAAHFTQFDLPDPADIAAVVADKSALVDGLIQGDNADLANITGALAPLPSTGPASSSVITWTSGLTTLVSDDGQTVTRPAFSNGDATTTLTATITKNLATDTKVFNLTVLKLPENTPPSFDPIADQSVDENSPQQEVLITNITPGDESDQILNIMAISSDPSIVSNPDVSGSGATRTLTYTPTTNGTVTITVTADDGGAENNTFTKTFSITINPDPDIALLVADKNALTNDSIKGGNDDLAHIRENLTYPLPTSGSNGSIISWMSSEPTRVSGDGTVTRPAFGEPDAPVTMTAQLSLNAQSDSKDFNLTVLAETINPDIAMVADDKDALDGSAIQGANLGLDSVTSALWLPTSGSINGSTIAWESSNTSVVSNDGAVNQPAFSAGNASVTLTATITRTFASSTKAFNVTVLTLEVSADTIITSETYSINTDEIDNKTIDNVAYGTSKTDFLAALTKNQAYQTWDSSDISDPVAEGNQLAVTAEDGATTAIYTISDLVEFFVTNERTGEKYETIQAAIDAAEEGDTISVAAGTYNENLNIDKALTLLGDPGDESAGPGENAPTIFNEDEEGNCWRNIYITASNVTVSGFYLDGNDCGYPVVRIAEEVSSTTISDNEIKNGEKGVDLPPYSSENLITNNIIHDNNNEGVWIGGSTNNTISNNEMYANGTGIGFGKEECDIDECVGDVSGNEITGNNIHDNTSSGIDTTNGVATFTELTISNNQITDNANYGIYFNEISDDATLTISKSVITGNGSQGIYLSTGEGESSNNTILLEDNTISNNSDEGIYVDRVENESTLDVLGNTLDGNSSYGININTTGDEAIVTIEDNTIKNNNDAGIYLGSSVSGVTMTGNTIQNNGVESQTTGIVISSASGNKARKNTISGNGNIEVSNDDENTENVFDAEENWWGTASLTEIEDKISGSVDFTPWYINPGMTILSPAISGETIDATTNDLDFKEVSDGEAGLPSGTSIIIMGNDGALKLASSTNAAEGGNIIIAGVTKTLSSFALKDSTTVDLTIAQTIGGQAVTVEKAVKLTSGSSTVPITLTNTAITNASVSIPDGTTIMAPSGWNGTIEPPKTGSASGAAPSGFSVGSTVISVGSPDVTLIFDTPVTLTLTGVTGPVGYKPAGAGSAWVQITNTCAGNYSNPTSPTFPNECAITNGTNTKIVTYHFTTFGSLVTESATSPVVVIIVPAGGGGYSPSRTTPTLSPTPVASTVAPQGEVLGVAVFRFSGNLERGMESEDIRELQNRLTKEGVYSGPVTGYFGPLTETAVIEYQKQKGIEPAIGYVGPITREHLNADTTKVTQVEQGTSAQAAVLRAQIVSLQAQLVTLLNELLRMFQQKLAQ